MKKLIPIILIIVIAFSMSACSSKETYTEISGVQKGETYEITPPSGWKMGNADGVIAYVPADFPETPSYISVDVGADPIVAELKNNQSTVEAQVTEALTSSYGESASFDLFEESVIGGVDCIHTRVSYSSEDGQVVQDQYSADSSSGSVIITFVNIGDDDFSEEFAACFDSISIN